MRVTLDQEHCGMTGQCSLLAPEVFRQRGDGVSEVILEEPPAEYHKAARDAGIGCPVGAIVVTEQEAA